MILILSECKRENENGSKGLGRSGFFSPSCTKLLGLDEVGEIVHMKMILKMMGWIVDRSFDR